MSEIVKPVQTGVWFSRWGFYTQEFAAAGVRTFAVVEGKLDAFPVLFLHGLPGGAFLWAPVLAAVGRSRRMIAPDWPGWGRSFSARLPQTPDFSPAGLQSWLHGVLSAQAVERFDLVAHGDACWPALSLFASDPQRVRRIALLDPCFTGERKSFFARWRKSPSWTEKKIRAFVEKNAALPDHDRMITLGDFFDHLVLKTPSALPGFRIEDYQPLFPYFREVLVNYRGAKMLIRGAADPHATPHHDAVLSFVPDVECHDVAGAGYYPMLETPEEVSRLLVVFLRD